MLRPLAGLLPSLLLVALPAVLRPVGAGAQEAVPSLSSARVAAQIGVGSIAAPVAFFGTGIASKRVAQAFGASEGAASRAGYIGAYTGTWLATAAVPAAIGRDGRFPAALAGSAAGLLASWGTVRLGNWRYDGGRRECGLLCWTMGAAVVALPSVGATLAYNASRR